MKRSILSLILSLAAYFASGQCGPYRISAFCTATPTVSGASAVDQIIWQLNGVAFDTVRRGAVGTTVAGGNGLGSAANQIVPSGVWLDASGNIYVADQNSNRIQKFPAGSTSVTNGTTVAGGNGAGSAANQLITPACVFIDGSGNIYVADYGNNRIQKFQAGSTSATNGTTIAGGNGSGSAANQLNQPQSVFIDGTGNIYVADFGNNRIQKFYAGSTSADTGITVAGGNGAGSAANQLNQPSSVYIDGTGNLYVADYGNDRIQKFPVASTSATNGTTVAGGNGAGSGANQFDYPGIIYVDGTGNLYVADILNNRVQKFPTGSTSATNGVTVAGNGLYGYASELSYPSGVYVSSSGSIYVADADNYRIQKWTQPAALGIDTSIYWGSTGSYSAIITDTLGCIATSDTVLDNFSLTSFTSYSICPGSSYSFGGHNLTTPGIYYDTVPGSWGCDSIITLFLSNQVFYTYIYDSICQGNFYSFGGQNLSSSGTYYDTLTMSSGCDSVVILFLTVKPNGSYTLMSRDSTCSSFLLSLSGASTASKIMWQENGVSFDSSQYGLIGPVTTVAGGNGAGSHTNQMGPTDVFVDSSGNIYVADAYNDRILKFPPNSTSATNGVVVAGGNGQGNAANQFYDPDAVYVDATGNIYVADLSNSRIQKFPANSTSSTHGVTVTGAGGQYYISGVFVDSSGDVYTCTPNFYTVDKFSPTNNTNTVVAGYNGQGSTAYQFNLPNSIYVDRSGYLYVADLANFRIQRFPPGSTSGTNGTTVAGGSANSNLFAPNQLVAPSGVWGDTSGYLYVLDAGNNRVQKFPPGSTSATNAITVAGGNGLGNAPNQFNLPGGSQAQYAAFLTGIYVDVQGNIYVADLGNGRIQKWSQPGIIGIDTSVLGPSNGSYTAIVTSTNGCVSYSNTITPHPNLTAFFTLQPSSTPHLWYLLNQCTGNGLSYVWNWGDSTTSTGDTPSHTYAASGYYNVCVSVTDSAGCTANYCDTNVYLFKDQSGQMVYINVVNQIPSGIHTINPDNLNINYYAGAVHFSESLQAPTELKLYDLSGRVVMQQDNFAGNTWNINPGIAQGVYIIHLQSGAYSTAKKLMIMQ